MYSGELIITGEGRIARRGGETWMSSNKSYDSIDETVLVQIVCTTFGKTVSWYSYHKEYSQCNVIDATYYYVAIG